MILVEVSMRRAEIDSRGSARRRGSTSPTLPCRYPLLDGRQVELSYLEPGDRRDLLAGFEGLSPRSRYLRFFSAMPELPGFMLDGLLRTDRVDHVAVCARLLDAEGHRVPPVVGVARYFRAEDSGSVAEPAIAVVDDLHRLGLGKHLLRRLSAIARANGVTRFRAQVLDGNRRMRTLLSEADAEIVDHDDDVLTYEIDIRKTENAPRGVLARLLAVMQGPGST